MLDSRFRGNDNIEDCHRFAPHVTGGQTVGGLICDKLFYTHGKRSHNYNLPGGI